MPTEETTSTAASGNSSGIAPCPFQYEQARVIMVVLYSVVFIVGFPANLLTVWFTWRQVRRKNVLGVYLWSLSVCDLIYLSTLPLWTLYVNNSHQWTWGSVTCKVTGFVFYTNMYISILLLCCVSADRYVAVRYALESRGLRRQRLAAGIAATVVATVLAAHVPVFVMREGDTGRQQERCFEPGHRPSRVVTAFNYARFFLGFLVPLVLLTVSNCGVMRAVRDSHSLHPGQKRRVRWLAVAVVALFLVCFAPYHLILLTRAAFSSHHSRGGGECDFSQWIYVPYNVSLGLSTLNSACNPLLYVLSSGDAREELSLALRRGQSDFTLAGTVECAGEATTRPILYRSTST